MKPAKIVHTHASPETDFFDVDRYLMADFFNREWAKEIKLTETENGYEIKLPIPAMWADKFNVDVEDRILTVTTERRVEEERVKRGYIQRRYNYDSFSKSFELPENAESEAIAMEFDHTYLTLSMTKTVQQQKIKIELN